MSKRTFLLLLAGLIMSQVFFPFNSTAQGNLLLTPRRVVFEGSTRSIDLNLANVGQDTATYAISLVQIRMTEEGNFETITEPDNGQRFASQNLRFFPRSVTLGPNEAQTVKIQLVRSGSLEPGEYRSHLYFRAIPKATPLGEEEKPLIDSSTISVTLTPIFGITIPAIIRVGQPSFNVTLSDLALTMNGDSIPQFQLTFNRTGNYSVYGDLAVDHISPQGTITRVGAANGVAVYTPNRLRRFKFNLTSVPGVDFAAGKIRVTFSAPTDMRPEKYAEAEVNLN
ncbi:MAG: molecular chaperone [Bacteroidia bacterium]|nr:MAG: molecular chaperone [Bacteroidia bacterium]